MLTDFKLGDYTDKQEEALAEAMKIMEPLLLQAEEAHLEKKLEIPGITWGTSDVVLRTGKRLTLVDYKFGEWLVDDPEDNYQARAYTLGAFHAFPDCTTAEFIFLTPKRKHVQRHTFTREEAMGWTAKLKAIVERAADPAAPYKPDSENCLFCGNKTNCPELLKRSMDIAKDTDGLQLPDTVQTTALTDPAQMKRALDVAAVVERWAKNVRSAALELRLEGVEIPGYDLVQKSGNRKITDVMGVWANLKDHLTQEEFLESCSMSITALEKSLKAQAPRGQKKEFAASTLEALESTGLVRRGDDKTYLSKTRK